MAKKVLAPDPGPLEREIDMNGGANVATVELRNLSTGTWRAIVCDGYKPDGTQNRIRRTIKVNPNSTEDSQRRQAQRQADALETDYRRHIITEAKKIRFSEVMTEFLENHSMADSTRAGYQALYKRRMEEKLGKIYIQDLTPRQIREFYKYLENDAARPAHNGKKGANGTEPPKSRSRTGKLSGTSRKHYHQLLSAVLSFAVKSGYIAINPMAAIDPPRQDTPESEFLEGEDIAHLMEVLDKLDPLWCAFFTIALFSSCRPGELIGLDWSDLTDNVLSIRAGSNYIKGVGTVRTDRPKTKASIRTIVLPPEAMQQLHRWKITQAEQRLKCGRCWDGSDAMFTNEAGNRLCISKPTHKWREVQKEYQLKDVPLYSLRHTGASLLIAAGCDVKEVSGRLGHSRTSTTLDTYTHLFEKAQQHTADVMSASIAKARREAT